MKTIWWRQRTTESLWPEMGEIDVAEMSRKIDGLIRLAYDEYKDIRAEIKKIVPEYKNKTE